MCIGGRLARASLGMHDWYNPLGDRHQTKAAQDEDLVKKCGHEEAHIGTHVDHIACFRSREPTVSMQKKDLGSP